MISSSYYYFANVVRAERERDLERWRHSRAAERAIAARADARPGRLLRLALDMRRSIRPARTAATSDGSAIRPACC